MGEKLFERAMRCAGAMGEPNDNTIADCDCGWEGKIVDCPTGWVTKGSHRMLAGRTGYEWYCPQCGEPVWAYWYIVS